MPFYKEHDIMATRFNTGKKMQIRFFFLALAVLLNLTSCASYDFSRRIVQQGNLLPAEKIERLHTGMSKQDVAILMGTSLISPTFNNNRWDYAYTWRRGTGSLEVRHLSLYFKGERLSSIEHRP